MQRAAATKSSTAGMLQVPAARPLASRQQAADVLPYARKASLSLNRARLYSSKQRVLEHELGTPHMLPTGLGDGIKAKVFSSNSRLTAQDKAKCMGWAQQLLTGTPGCMDELSHKKHAQLQLDQLLHSLEGQHLVRYLWQSQLAPFVAVGMHVAAFEVVFSQGNNKLKPHYKGHLIHNKLGCQHQDLREDEPWFNRAAYLDLPGNLRLVLDISPQGQRWFEFRLLHSNAHDGLWLDEAPLLQVSSDLVAFDRLAAGSGGFSNPGGSWIFHARRSSSPQELGVSVVADLVVTAGLDGCSAAEYCHTPAYAFFHAA